MGFIKSPDRGYSESDLTYFKPLIEINKSINCPNENNKLELWNLEPHQVKNEKQKWSWNIENNTYKFFKPIIQPCNCNWNIRWTKNGKIVREDKVKYFSTNDNLIEFGHFLYIRKLNE